MKNVPMLFKKFKMNYIFFFKNIVLFWTNYVKNNIHKYVNICGENERLPLKKSPFTSYKQENRFIWTRKNIVKYKEFFLWTKYWCKIVLVLLFKVKKKFKKFLMLADNITLPVVATTKESPCNICMQYANMKI